MDVPGPHIRVNQISAISNEGDVQFMTYRGMLTAAVFLLFLQKLAITASFWIAAIIVSELLLNPIIYFYLEPPHIDVIEKREHGFFKRMLESIAGPMLICTPG